MTTATRKPASPADVIKGLVTLAVLGVAVVFGIHACSGSSTDDAKDQAFLVAIDHDKVPSVGDMRDLGHRVCADLDKGDSGQTVWMSVGNLQSEQATVNTPATYMFTTDQARMIVNDAITSYCPAHSDQILR